MGGTGKEQRAEMIEEEALGGLTRQMELSGAYTRDGGATSSHGEAGAKKRRMTCSVLNRCQREEWESPAGGWTQVTSMKCRAGTTEFWRVPTFRRCWKRSQERCRTLE